jgi:hypothetical protein
MALSIALLVLACGVAKLAAHLPPPPVWQPQQPFPENAGMASGGYYGGEAGVPAGQYGNDPAAWPVGPGLQPPWQRRGGRPLPYPDQWQPYSY